MKIKKTVVEVVKFRGNCTACLGLTKGSFYKNNILTRLELIKIHENADF